MSDFRHYGKITNGILLVILLSLLFWGNLPMFIATNTVMAVFMILRTLSSKINKRGKLYLIISYLAVLNLEFLFNKMITFNPDNTGAVYILCKVFSVMLLLLPLIVEWIVIVNRQVEFYLPSIEDLTNISFEHIRKTAGAVNNKVKTVDEVRKKVSVRNLMDVFTDMDRHSSVKYVNNGTLTDEYFREAYATLDDQNIYIIISNTGSPAGEILSVFTKKQFNHASISFDKDLKTIVSYNGGEKIYPPGMNREMVEYFNKKKDASILVYRLRASKLQKENIIDKVKQINDEGSAYNIMGLVTKRSFKPNIMFCSQFVYKMLKIGNIAYFDKKDAAVRPTDFVEMDYYRQLEFECEITFN